MRHPRRRLLLVVWVVVVGVGGCGTASQSGGIDASVRTRAREANRAILQALPHLPGSTSEGSDELGPPPGGTGVMAERRYQAPPEMSPSEIVAFFERSMADWRRICRQDRPQRAMTTLRRGPAWLAISAGTYDDQDGPRRPGLTIAVNALDGDIMERDFVTGQICD